MTSVMSIAAVPLINKNRIVMISPTTSTTELSGRDDYFFSVTTPNIFEIKKLAYYAFENMNFKRISVVYDLSNFNYTRDYLNNFKNYFKSMGGEILEVKTFRSSNGEYFLNMANLLIHSKPDAVLIIAGDEDTAMICQQLKKLERAKIPILSCGWAMTDNFLKVGGPSVEGVIFSQLFNKNNKNKRYLLFRKGYKNRFGQEPGFAAVMGYDAANVLFSSLNKSGNPKYLKETILMQEIFHGLQGDFKIDRFGDVDRKSFIIIVKNGNFVIVE